VVRGAYESNERALIMDHVPRSANVLELGGGIGFVATYLAEHLDVDATQVVVEANPDLLPVIERHRDLNDATFTTLGAAYDPASNRVRLRRDGPVTGTTTVGVDDKDEMGHPRSNGNERKNPTAVSVPGVSLAELVDQFGPGPFTLVADIEGAEEGLVTGELETLVAHCPRLILELHDGPSLTAGEIRARVFDAGYEEVDRMEAVGVYER
jgi:FkbM family methyltransferase